MGLLKQTLLQRKVHMLYCEKNDISFSDVAVWKPGGPLKAIIRAFKILLCGEKYTTVAPVFDG
jgi:hypothetical protein